MRKPTADLYVRMLGYRAHIMRRHRNMRLAQIVIVLGRGRVQYEDDLDNGFMLGLRAVYLPRADPDEFLSRPGLAVLAELAKGNQKARFRSAPAALQVIESLPESRRQGLRDAMYTLATISFDPTTIDLIREESRMTVESIIEFYDQTKIGREVHGILRARGSAGVLAALIRNRFGDDVRIPDAARALARIPEDVSVTTIERATSLEDLLSHLPSAEPDRA